jgi:hypothetical protein
MLQTHTVEREIINITRPLLIQCALDLNGREATR